MIVQVTLLALLAGVHLFGGRLHFVDRFPRSRWLSAAGGIAVAYVFLHLFPELERAQRHIGEEWGVVPYIENHAYLLALIGLAAFYGVERMVKVSRDAMPGEHDETTTPMGVFWIHIASFSVYNALIGYLLAQREQESVRSTVAFAVAMALHFFVNDAGLRHHHKKTYRRVGRWVLTAAIVGGWLAGMLTTVSEAARAVVFAFIAGGVVLNVLKEELPDERASQFVPFALGAAGYAAILLMLE